MKWLKILLAIAEVLIPGWSKVSQIKLSDDHEVALGLIKELTKDMTPGKKVEAVLTAVGNLKAAKKFKQRLSNKLDKAKDRLARKFL